MHSYLDDLIAAMEKIRDPEKAGPMSAYMRHLFPYLGIKSPELAAIAQAFYAKNGLPPIGDLASILIDLWELPEREYQYVGVGLLRRCAKMVPPGFIGPIETMLVTKSWWDTVDSIAGGTVGSHFSRYPEVRDETLPFWRTSSNFWLRRSAILFQLDYKENTDFPLLCDIIQENLGSKEFFINKAIGWSLRQVSRYNETGVRAFVANTDLHPLSKREALKWLDRKAEN